MRRKTERLKIFDEAYGACSAIKAETLRGSCSDFIVQRISTG
jgi:hypothetical protein